MLSSGRQPSTHPAPSSSAEGMVCWVLAQCWEVARGCEGLHGLQPCAHSLALAAWGPLFLVLGLIPQLRAPCWSLSPANSQVPLCVLFVEVGGGAGKMPAGLSSECAGSLKPVLADRELG